MPKGSKMKILVCDPLGDEGIQIFESDPRFKVESAIKATPAELKEAVSDAVAVVVRSGTTLTRDIINSGKELKIIGRAGVGVDNVDVDAASHRGIVVVNTPAGNTISAAEHTMSLILAMARNIAPAHQSMCQGQWDRKTFTGVELFEKTLGLIGLGRIGGEVARRALSFGMKILAFDPYLRAEKARELGVIQVGLEEIFKESDFISLHVPLTEETRYLLNEKNIKLMKTGVRIVNCARGGLIDEKAMLKALESGKVAGLALDVFEKEPPEPSALLSHSRVLKTPHLGASTEEAQKKVAVDVAKTIVDYLSGRGLKNAVNMPVIDAEILNEIEPALDLTEKLGKFEGQLAQGSLKKVELKLYGKFADYPTQPLLMHLFKGLLSPILDTDVNVINALILAKERGIEISVSQYVESTTFANLMYVSVITDKESRSIAGTLYSRKDPRIVMIDDLGVEAEPKGYILVIENQDVPGIIGHIGTLLGKHEVNIADMSVGRDIKKKIARTVIAVDNSIPEPVLKKLKSHKNIVGARFVKL